ncbi:hypothetical protein K474DRAFT_1587114 [Panus rudis PR-1116 ss-1]|nr:hypothetical protein K474DRAFT_1587114 [Panus rudis PR-1116 ss-1]
MDSVEIKSPFRFPKPSLRDQGSPVPSNRQKSTNNTLRDRSPSPSTSTKPASEVFPPAPVTPSRTRTYSNPRRSSRRQLADSSESDFDQFLDEDATPRATAKKSPSKSPVKGKGKARADVSDAEELPDELPDYLHACLQAQKRAALKSLYNLSAVPTVNDEDDEDIPANRIAYEQLNDLLKGTVLRAEGNSCIVTGPPGSGKTQLVEEVISGLPGRPIVIRLSGHAQTDDRLAMREIAWQLAQQTGRSLLPKEETADQEAQDEENPFLDTPPETAEPVISIPPPAHLLALISVIPTLSRPTIIVLDAFELFALHPRQSLLYCLFDTAQHSRVGANGKGMAVVGVTTRIDTINLLEKRVKSRFSGRILRTAGPGKLEQWVDISRIALCAPLDEQEGAEEWTLLWKKAINAFLESEVVRDALEDTFELTRDLRMLTRILTPIIAELTPSVPFPTPARLKAAIVTQRAPGHQSFLRSLPYPAMCLLIAAMHARTAGHDIFTFEMLHEEFRDQVRTSHSAPVQVEGGGIGMVRCSRDVLMGSFEKLVSLKVFIPVAAPSVGIAKEFVRYRCSLERADVKTAVDKLGQLNLKKWFTKGRGG